MKLKEIVEVLDASLLIGESRTEREFTICRGSDLMSDVLAFFAGEGLFLTGLATVQAVRTAAVSGVGAIVFVRGKIPAKEIVAVAQAEDIPLIVTPLSMFVSCGRLYSNGLAGYDGRR